MTKKKQIKMTVTKEISFDAAHFLPASTYTGSCNNLHGHRFKLQVAIKREVGEHSGMVIDFKILKKALKQRILDRVDHQLLNKIILNPTAENIVLWAWESLIETNPNIFKSLKYIKLWETPESCCILEVDDIKDQHQKWVQKYSILGETEW